MLHKKQRCAGKHRQLHQVKRQVGMAQLLSFRGRQASGR